MKLLCGFGCKKGNACVALCVERQMFRFTKNYREKKGKRISHIKMIFPPSLFLVHKVTKDLSRVTCQTNTVSVPETLL